MPCGTLRGAPPRNDVHAGQGRCQISSASSPSPSDEGSDCGRASALDCMNRLPIVTLISTGDDMTASHVACCPYDGLVSAAKLNESLTLN